MSLLDPANTGMSELPILYRIFNAFWVVLIRDVFPGEVDIPMR
jgi:hypothetical protein